MTDGDHALHPDWLAKHDPLLLPGPKGASLVPLTARITATMPWSGHAPSGRRSTAASAVRVDHVDQRFCSPLIQ